MPIDLRNIDPELSYPLKEVAGFLGISYGTILKLKKEATLKAIKIGKRYYIKGKDILAYVGEEGN